MPAEKEEFGGGVSGEAPLSGVADACESFGDFGAPFSEESGIDP